MHNFRLLTLRCHALLCLSNFFAGLDIQDLGGPNNVYQMWLSIGSLIFKQTGRWICQNCFLTCYIWILLIRLSHAFSIHFRTDWHSTSGSSYICIESSTSETCWSPLWFVWAVIRIRLTGRMFKLHLSGDRLVDIKSVIIHTIYFNWVVSTPPSFLGEHRFRSWPQSCYSEDNDLMGYSAT